MRIASCLVVSAVAATLAAPARAADGLCLSADAPPVTAPATSLRFGITPQLAGTVGGAQGAVVPEDQAKAITALGRLKPPGKQLVVRLNRLFMSDGHAGVERFAALAQSYRLAGFGVESQVRYHPAPAQEGDMAAWEAFVRDAARTLGANPALVSLTITNEVNLPLSANTSDGAYKGALDAITRGVPAARDELDGMGRRDVAVGISYAYRYLPTADVDFFKGIGARSTPAFRAALDYVGVQLYPGLFFPPAFLPGQTAGSAVIEALALVRDCYLPLAGLGPDVHLWVTENGYATNLGHTTDRQDAELGSTLEAVHDWSVVLGITDYRYFNLRDNRPSGTDLFDDVGLLDATYAEKPAYATYRRAIERYGAAEPAVPSRVRLQVTVTCHGRVLRAALRGTGTGRVRQVDFTVAGRRVLRDRAAPFGATIAARRFGRAARWAVAARVTLDDGRLVTRSSSRPRCSV